MTRSAEQPSEEEEFKGKGEHINQIEPHSSEPIPIPGSKRSSLNGAAFIGSPPLDRKSQHSLTEYKGSRDERDDILEGEDELEGELEHEEDDDDDQMMTAVMTIAPCDLAR